MLKGRVRFHTAALLDHTLRLPLPSEIIRRRAGLPVSPNYRLSICKFRSGGHQPKNTVPKGLVQLLEVIKIVPDVGNKTEKQICKSPPHGPAEFQ